MPKKILSTHPAVLTCLGRPTLAISSNTQKPSKHLLNAGKRGVIKSKWLALFSGKPDGPAAVPRMPQPVPAPPLKPDLRKFDDKCYENVPLSEMDREVYLFRNIVIFGMFLFFSYLGIENMKESNFMERLHERAHTFNVTWSNNDDLLATFDAKPKDMCK